MSVVVLVRESDGAHEWKCWSRCVRKGMQVRYAVGAGTHRCGRRCVGLVAWVREGGAVVYSGGGGAGVGARYSILGVNRNQSELIGIYRRISDKL